MASSTVYVVMEYNHTAADENSTCHRPQGTSTLAKKRTLLELCESQRVGAADSPKAKALWHVVETTPIKRDISGLLQWSEDSNKRHV